MANRNDQTNSLIKWGIIIGDFIILNILLWGFLKLHPSVSAWDETNWHMFMLVCNFALTISEYKFYTVIHRRLVTSSDILQRIVAMTMVQAFIAYVIMKTFNYSLPVGKVLLSLGTLYFVFLLIARSFERWMVKKYRKSGGNFRTVVFAGDDEELLNVYERLMQDPTRGFRILGYYGNKELTVLNNKLRPLIKLGTLDELLANVHQPDQLTLGDDMYVCVSRRKPDVVKTLSTMCEEKVIRFYYVPVSVETIGLNLKRELLDDIEVYATYENPLANPVNRAIKRVFDIVASSFALLLILPFLPIIAFMIKKQSPKGPILFKQPRTGLDGKEYLCYKFRSMHPNKDESGLVQATKDDPRKFPFGDLMRRTSIDELPQFWNVLKGDMSIVGPRPHPVKLNEKYTALIDKYMVRHFVKPGITGYAQVTGFRGETEELWQMEGRVKRDIWYMEHWNFWLDMRIMWLTIKQIVMKDEQAY